MHYHQLIDKRKRENFKSKEIKGSLKKLPQLKTFAKGRGWKHAHTVENVFFENNLGTNNKVKQKC